MKIRVKQVWDMAVEPDMTLSDVRHIVMAVRVSYPDDECFLTNKGGRLVIRRVAQ